MKRSFGRYFVEDSRDYLISKGKTKRTYRYWRDSCWFGDQKNTPHCVGFAWAHWLSAGPVVNNLNPDGIYYLAKFIDEWPGENYDGTSVRAGAKVLHKLGLISSYAWAKNLETLCYALLEIGPIVAGTIWTRGMSNPDKYGFVRPTGRLLGGHAYLLTGINLNLGVIRCKNSWGRDYGINGRFYIRLSDFELLMDDYGEVCDALEQLPSASY